MLPINFYWITGGGLFLLGIIFLWLVFRNRKSTPDVFSPLTDQLQKTQSRFTARIEELLGRRSKIDADLFAELEEILIASDVGVKTTQKLLTHLSENLKSTQTVEPAAIKQLLKQAVIKVLETPLHQLAQPPLQIPQVILMVGINGVGKTTTLGKLAKKFRLKGQKILLVAADTFRAGAIDQLKVWGDRVDAPVLAQNEGADPAAVAFDGVKAATARGMDKVLVDTAGRLHTKVNLMEEMKKIKRVIGKALEGAPHEIWIVVDATTGQNALAQAREFHDSLQLTGIILTKLDGTAKGGIVIGICDELGVPIRYVGVGEQVEDLREFNASEFAEALMN